MLRSDHFLVRAVLKLGVPRKSERKQALKCASALSGSGARLEFANAFIGSLHRFIDAGGWLAGWLAGCLLAASLLFMDFDGFLWIWCHNALGLGARPRNNLLPL